MGASVHGQTVRPEATSGRTTTTPRRTASQMARFDATAVAAPTPDGTQTEAPDLDVEAVRAVLEHRKLLVKRFAINAGVARSQVSEALAGAAGRKIALAWVLAQEEDQPGFVRQVFDEIERRMGLTPAAQRIASFEALVELLRVVWFRERRKEPAT